MVTLFFGQFVHVLLMLPVKVVFFSIQGYFSGFCSAMSANSLTFAVEKEKSIVVMEGEASKKEIKRIPYGMMNFVDVREDNCYYVDKTRFIEKVEEANKYFFFIRPRRFGKSLTLSMLRHYYDINQADKFERLYGDLYIGQHPTPNHNKYLIIYQ